MEELTEIVVRLMPNHPTWHRNRAGFTFTTDPIAISVTKEEYEAIANDKYLKIITSWTAFEQWLENEVEIPKTDVVLDKPKDVEPNEDKPKDDKNLEKLKKKDLIELCKKKGLKPWIDFNWNTPNQNLIDLLNTI